MRHVLVFLLVVMLGCSGDTLNGVDEQAVPTEAVLAAKNMAAVGGAVPLNFRLHKFNASGVEIALNNPRVRTFFIQFDVSMEGLQPVVTMAGLSNGSRLKGSASRRKLPAFPFLRQKDGTPVLHFSFDNQIVEDGQGNQVLLMTYSGVPVPLVETLVIARPMTLPPALSRRLGAQGPVQFQPGRLTLDREVQGFWIPLTPPRGE